MRFFRKKSKSNAVRVHTEREAPRTGQQQRKQQLDAVQQVYAALGVTSHPPKVQQRQVPSAQQGALFAKQRLVPMCQSTAHVFRYIMYRFFLLQGALFAAAKQETLVCELWRAWAHSQIVSRVI